MQIGIKIAGLTVFAALVCAAGETSATINRTETSGNVCMPTDSTQMGRLAYTLYGPGNTSSTNNATVICSLPSHRSNISTGNDPDVFTATVYDRNTSANVSCTLSRVGASGNPVWSATLATPTTPFTLNSQTLIWNGLPTTTLQYFYTIECSLPPATGFGASHVASFFYDGTN